MADTELADKKHSPSGAADGAEEASARNTRLRWIVLAGLILAAIMEVLDTTIINVALPQMAGNLGTTTQDIAWVSTGYILSNVIVLPMTAFLTARFGRRNYLTASIVIFTITSFLCGISHSLGEIILWRILQGGAGAALISTAQATLVQVFPPKEQGIVQPLFFMGLVVAPTVGPALGGYLTDALSWHWCFLINIPIGIIAATIVYTCLYDTVSAKADHGVDWLGIGLLTVGLGTLQYILEEGERDDWFQSGAIVRLSLLSGAALVGLVFWLLSPWNRSPVVDLRVLRNPSVSAGIVLFIATGFGLYGVTYLYPLLAQTLQGLTSQQTGMALLPGGMATAFSIVFCATILTRPGNTLDPRILIYLGITASVIAMGQLSHFSSQSGVQDAFWPLLIRGLSIGFMIIPINQTSISSLSQRDVGQGAALLGLGRQLGGSFGIAILATFLDTQTHIHRAYMVPYLTPASPAFNLRMSMLTGNLMAHGYGLSAARQGALGIMDQILSREVLAKSFNATFVLLMLVSLATARAVLILRKPKPGADAGMGGH